MLAKITNFVKENKLNIVFFIIFALFLMLSFSAGFIVAKYQNKEQIQITSF